MEMGKAEVKDLWLELESFYNGLVHYCWNSWLELERVEILDWKNKDLRELIGSKCNNETMQGWNSSGDGVWLRNRQ